MTEAQRMLKQLIREEKQNRVSRILLPASITVLLLGIFILPHFVFGIAVVHGGSMEPTLKDGTYFIYISEIRRRFMPMTLCFWMAGRIRN